MSSRIGAKGLSSLLEKEEKDEHWVGKRTSDLGQKTTSMKAFSSGTFGGPLVSKGYCDVSPLKVTNFGTLGRPNTSGEMGTSKRAGKLLLGDTPSSPESGIRTRAMPAILHVNHLKMDMPSVFIASRQQNVRG